MNVLKSFTEWGCSSVIKHLHSICEVLGSIPSTAKRKKVILTEQRDVDSSIDKTRLEAKKNMGGMGIGKKPKKHDRI
jgi:hypothetical protein